jgi:thioredoxin 1
MLRYFARCSALLASCALLWSCGTQPQPAAETSAPISGGTETATGTRPPIPVAVTAENFELEVRRAAIPVIVLFWAEWAGPAKRMLPVLDRVARVHGGTLIAATVEVDSNPELTSKYEVRAVPTLLAFVEGELVHRIVGDVSDEQVERVIDDLLSKR